MNGHKFDDQTALNELRSNKVALSTNEYHKSI